MKYRLYRFGRWLKRSWKDMLAWVVMIVIEIAVFAMGFGLCFIFARDEVLFYKDMTAAPKPEVCALCRNGEGIKIHAPCIINLSTGDVAELSVYEPHSNEIGEVSIELKKGYFAISFGAGANIVRNPENEYCEASLPRKEEKIDPSRFCYDCRRIISEIDRYGYVIADMYDLDAISVYKVWDGAKYEIRDYLVTINKTENKNYEIEVHGLLEQEDR